MRNKIVIALLSIAATLVACGAGPNGPQISVHDAWARPVPTAGGNGVVYLRLVNVGNEADQLLGSASPLATAVEVHKTTMTEGVMKMEAISGLEIPGKGELDLKPGDIHLMLIELNKPLVPGDMLPLVLRFDKSGEIKLEVEVREP